MFGMKAEGNTALHPYMTLYAHTHGCSQMPGIHSFVQSPSLLNLS